MYSFPEHIDQRLRNIQFNVLIMDDNPVVADCVEKRMTKANEAFKESTGVTLHISYLKIDVSDLDKCAGDIENYLHKNSVHFLVLDRSFFTAVGPEEMARHQLDSNYLYRRKGEETKLIEQILQRVDFSKNKDLSGVLVYTYDDPDKRSEWHVEPAKIKADLYKALDQKVAENNIQVILANTDIHHLADLKLYINTLTGDYIKQGKKSNFMLYGLFVGELLYHRLLKMIEAKQKKRMISMQAKTRNQILLLFIVFTALGTGGNAAYALLSGWLKSDRELLVISIVFSVLFPLLITWLKPGWILSLSLSSSPPKED